MQSFKKNYSFLIAVFSFLGLAITASAQTAEYIIGFSDININKISNAEKSALDFLLKPTLKSKRERKVAITTNGRFQRQLSKAVVKGQQKYLGLINAKIISSTAVDQSVNVANLQSLQNAGLIKYLDPNIKLYAFKTPNDPSYNKLWGMQNNTEDFFSTPGVDVSASAAWDIRTDSGNIAIAILDTGSDPAHSDLKDNFWTNSGEIAGNKIDDDGNGYVDDVNGCDFIAYDSAKGKYCGEKPFHNNSHGTHVAGTIGARGNNGIGVSGVLWQTNLVSLAFLDDKGAGSLDDMIEGIAYAVEMKKLYDKSGGKKGANIRVINASFGHADGFLQSEHDAIKMAGQNNIAFIAAAGNGGPDGLGDNNDSAATFPANYELDNIITVAALGKGGKLTYFSNYGANSVDIAAPGDGIYSTSLKNGYESLSGTSMAAPHVSGAVGMLIAQKPSFSISTIKEILLASAKDGTQIPELKSLSGKVLSAGVMDINEALVLSSSDISSVTITKQPVNTVASLGSKAIISVSVIGKEPLDFQWFKDDVKINGAKSSSFTIAKVSDGDAGRYSCSISNGSTQATSKAATLTVVARVKADANNDGVVDLKDIFAVMLNFNKTGTGITGDLNSDGVVNTKDLDIVLKALRG